MLLTHSHSFFRRELCRLANSVFRILVSRESCPIYPPSRPIHHQEVVLPLPRVIAIFGDRRRSYPTVTSTRDSRLAAICQRDSRTFLEILKIGWHCVRRRLRGLFPLQYIFISFETIFTRKKSSSSLQICFWIIS